MLLKFEFDVNSTHYGLAGSLQPWPNDASQITLFHPTLLWQMQWGIIQREGNVILHPWDDLPGLLPEGGGDPGEDSRGRRCGCRLRVWGMRVSPKSQKRRKIMASILVFPWSRNLPFGCLAQNCFSTQKIRIHVFPQSADEQAVIICLISWQTIPLFIYSRRPKSDSYHWGEVLLKRRGGDIS